MAVMSVSVTIVRTYTDGTSFHAQYWNCNIPLSSRRHAVLMVQVRLRRPFIII